MLITLGYNLVIVPIVPAVITHTWLSCQKKDTENLGLVSGCFTSEFFHFCLGYEGESEVTVFNARPWYCRSNKALIMPTSLCYMMPVLCC